MVTTPTEEIMVAKHRALSKSTKRKIVRARTKVVSSIKRERWNKAGRNSDRHKRNGPSNLPIETPIPRSLGLRLIMMTETIELGLTKRCYTERLSHLAEIADRLTI